MDPTKILVSYSIFSLYYAGSYFVGIFVFGETS